ncbi:MULTISPECIES: N-acetyltransferase [Bacillaceae]|uniref:GNAT family N-acetyltransferase n=1 Tax=Bacillaceae TaxID=186817 RepID=UPI001CEF9FF3|nr:MULTISPECIES: GNAT family N-acetyltransferase [Bacillaceae]
MKTNAVTFDELRWDTDFFGISSARATLHRPLTQNEWLELKVKFEDYQFISIVNEQSEPGNSQLIGKDTHAFLADVNVQFKRKLGEQFTGPSDISIQSCLERNNLIIELADFQYSKFSEDPEFANRGGEKVYSQWLLNAFEKPDKYFALSKNQKGELNGFLLFSYSNDVCIVELIAVSKKCTNSGTGTRLFRAVEAEAYKQGSKEIQVGTQIRNIGAINFYHKVGCKQVGCHQVFHLWNKAV